MSEKMREDFEQVCRDLCIEKPSRDYDLVEVVWTEAIEAALRTHEKESEAGAVAIVERNEAFGDTCLVFRRLPTSSDISDGAKLFLDPPSAKLIETAAIMRCAELMVERGVLSRDGTDYQALLALIPQDGRTALEELLRKEKEQFGRKVAFAVYEQHDKLREDETFDGFKEIVTNLIGVPPLNSETVSGEE